MRVAAVVLTAGALFAAVAGCSPSPRPPATAPATRLSPPIVGAPISLSEFEKAPCGLMGPDQLAKFYLVAPGTVLQVPAGMACRWVPGDPKSPSYQAAADVSSGGLEALYRKRSSIPVFESTTVHSYPAVHVDDDKRGHCTVDVGVADDTLLIVTAAISDPKAPGYDDPCTDADRLASSIVGYQGHRAP